MLRLDNVTLVGIEGVDLNQMLLAAAVCQHYCRFGAVKIFTPFDYDDERIVRIPPLSYDDYNRFVIRSLHEHVETNHLLLIQHDGFVLNPDGWSDEFLEYDYIGAPWQFDDGLNVGNGGFSLRSKRLLETASECVEGPPWSPEDRLLCRRYRKVLEEDYGIRFAPVSLASRFSIDGVFGEPHVWDGEFGFHNFRTTDLSKWTPPPDLSVGLWPAVKRTWELERRAQLTAVRSRRTWRRIAREHAQLQTELDTVRRLTGAMPSQFTGSKEDPEDPEFLESNLDMTLRNTLAIIQERILNRTTYSGVKAVKNPFDFWVYQEILFEVKPDVIIEIGNQYGGSTLALAHILDHLGKGVVVGVDVDHSKLADVVRAHPRISLITGDACRCLDAIKERVREHDKVLIIEDSSHTYRNTLNILRKFSSLVTLGSYFIVEDSVLNHGLDEGPSPGPYEAIEEFLRDNDCFEIDRTRESFLITWNPKGYLKRIR